MGLLTKIDGVHHRSTERTSDACKTLSSLLKNPGNTPLTSQPKVVDGVRDLVHKGHRSRRLDLGGPLV